MDETLYQRRRQADKRCHLTGDSVDGGGVRGPWVVGLVWMSTGECCLFKVKRGDGQTLARLIRRNVLPETMLWTDRWAGYLCVPQQSNPAGPMGLLH